MTAYVPSTFAPPAFVCQTCGALTTARDMHTKWHDGQRMPNLYRDREPQPSDGPDYPHDHAAWERRQP